MNADCVFEPVNGANAVAETVFFFEFTGRPFTEEIIRNKLVESYLPKLPIFEESPAVEFNFDTKTGATSQKITPAFAFATVTEPGAPPDWVVRVNGGQVSIHCTAYTRWDAVFEEALHLLDLLLECAKGDLSLDSAGLKVLDRFIALSNNDAYCLESIFKTESKFLPAKAFESGDRWHVNSGWFWDGNNGDKILSQLNVDASVHYAGDENPRRVLSIDHVQVVRRDNDEPFSLRAASAIEFTERARDFFTPLHLLNKSIMADLLTDDVLRKLNLTVKSL